MSIHSTFTIREHGVTTEVACGQLADGRFFEMTYDGRLSCWIEGVECDPYALLLSAGV